jgi:multidrug efflux pump subunit AcrB
VLAVDEVRPPVILATLAVILSFLPLFFITGMMGPYMRPMPLNVPVAMLRRVHDHALGCLSPAQA